MSGPPVTPGGPFPVASGQGVAGEQEVVKGSPHLFEVLQDLLSGLSRAHWALVFPLLLFFFISLH